MDHLRVLSKILEDNKLIVSKESKENVDGITNYKVHLIITKDNLESVFQKDEKINKYFEKFRSLFIEFKNQLKTLNKIIMPKLQDLNLSL